MPLKGAQQIPVRSFLDTKRGTVRLTSATRVGARDADREFSTGLFQVLQSGKRSAERSHRATAQGIDLPALPAGPPRQEETASAAAPPPPDGASGRLRGNAKGRFRTRGRYSSATVRGTIWTTTDRCDGTLTKVSRGRVAVRDFRRKKNISLRRGKSYLARAPG